MKKLATLVAVATIVLAGCSGSGQQDQSKTLNVELPLKTKTLAPYDTDVPVKMGAAESLFKVNKKGNVEKLLVEKYNQPSAKELNLTIKDDINFQNGKHLTGQSVKKSLEYSLKHSDLVKGSLPIEQIKADGQQVQITTKEPYPELISELASPFAAIYDVNANSDIKNKPIGTGPYQIKSHQQSQKIGLQQYKDYWQGQPKMDKINVTYQEDGNVRASDLKSGKADVITDVPVEKVKSLKADDKTKISNVSGFRTGMLLYNHDSDKMTKPVRQALDKVIDRHSITQEISKGYAKPANGPFNDSVSGIKHNKVQQQNLEEAKKILKKEGYTKEHPLKIVMPTYNGRPELPKIAQVIQSDAKKVNIEIDVRNVDDIDGYLKDKSQWDASMYSMGTLPRGDTGYFFNQAYKTGGAINQGNYHNKQVDQLINQFNTTVDNDKRQKLTNEILDITARDYANSYITYNDTIVGLNKQVQNVNATPEGIYLIDHKVEKTDD